MESVSDSRSAAGTGNRIIRQCSLLFGLALFGYPVIGNIISLLQVDSRTLSVPFRILVASWSLWIIVISGKLRMDRLRKVMLFIWLVYGLRLLHDWLFTNLDGADYALEFFLACSVLPAIALMKAKLYDQRKFAMAAFGIATLGSIMSIFVLKFGNADRQDLSEVSRLSLAAVDPVTLGHLAVSALLCAFALWPGCKVFPRIILVCLCIPVVACLLLTGSKGPALTLVISVGLLATRRRNLFRFAMIAAPAAIWLIVSDASPLGARIAASSDDQSTLDRIVVLSDSIQQIADAPWIGSAFVELNSGFYPHNVFVEAAMALGLPIGVLFTGLVLFGAIRAWRDLRGNNYLLGLLYIQAILASAISGSLYGSTMLWVVLALFPIMKRWTEVSRGSETGVSSSALRYS